MSSLLFSPEQILNAILHRALLTLLVFLGLSILPAVAAADGPLDQQAREIAKDLQCPICENMSVADSPSNLAGQMRDSVREQLEAGRTRQEILDYFVARYGESVLRNPPKEGINLLVWGVPPVVLGVATLLVVRMLRRQRAVPEPGEEESVLMDPEREHYQQLLEQELRGRTEGRA